MLCTWIAAIYSIILAWWLVFCENRSNNSSNSWEQELCKLFLIRLNLIIVLTLIFFPADDGENGIVVIHNFFEFFKIGKLSWFWLLWINTFLITFKNFGCTFLGLFCVSSGKSDWLTLFFCRNIRIQILEPKKFTVIF